MRQRRHSGCGLASFLAALLVLVLALGLVYVTDNVPQRFIDLVNPMQFEMPTTLPPVARPVELSRAGRFRFQYMQLNEQLQAVYRLIYDALPSFPESIAIPRIGEADMQMVFNALVYDQPLLFMISSTRYRIRLQDGYVVGFMPEYRLDRDEYVRRVQTVADRASEIPLPPGGTDFEIQLALHDFLLANCTYSDDLTNCEIATVYGALIVGEASCVGYSKAMLLLLELNGIDAYIVTGYAENASFSGPHAWNKVRLGGNWYYMDATWNDPVMPDGREIVSRAYFNLTAQELSATHELGPSMASSTAMNYFRARGLYFDALDRSTEARIAQAIVEAVQARRGVAELRMSDAAGFAQAQEYLFGRQGRIHRILAAANLQHLQVYRSSVDELNIIRIFLVEN